MRRTRYIPKKQKLIIRGFGRNDLLPVHLLHPLIEDGTLKRAGMHRVPFGQRLEIVLANPDKSTPETELCGLAVRLAKIAPKYRAVKDPCAIRRLVNVDMLAELIGDVLRHAARQETRSRAHALAG